MTFLEALGKAIDMRNGGVPVAWKKFFDGKLVVSFDDDNYVKVFCYSGNGSKFECDLNIEDLGEGWEVSNDITGSNTGGAGA